MTPLELAYQRAKAANFHNDIGLNDYSLRFGFWQRLSTLRIEQLNLVTQMQFEEDEDDDTDGFTRYSYKLKTK